jgi:phosphonoacetate hydrolase
VAHHGALGSFAQVHLPLGMEVAQVRDWLLARVGITECHERKVGARLLELPEDRMGDLVVASARNVVLGRTPDYHDLTALAGALRSHGGRYEEMVPLVFSEPLNAVYASRAAGDVRNFDVFEFTCNGAKK